MNDEHLEAEIERLDEQGQRMAHEYCELAKAHADLIAKIERLENAGDAMYFYLLGNSKITANQWEVRQGWDNIRNNRPIE
jgi:hypothetical protein